MLTKVGWLIVRWYMELSVFCRGAVLIVMVMVVFLGCNQREDIPDSTPTIVSESRIGSGGSPSLDSQERSQEMLAAETIPLIPDAGDL